LNQAAQVVVESGTASVSMIQRRLRVGYTRAGRLIDMLERRGIISGYEGSKPRQVLVGVSDLPRVLGSGGAPAAASDETGEQPELAGAPE
jgi:S-DNA-T family DNA segregation ATPase FtsK/SpoIIIE